MVLRARIRDLLWQWIVGFITGMFGSRLVRRLGMRTLLITATAATGFGFLILANLPTGGHYSPLLGAVVPVGFGTIGTVFGTMVMAASGMADADQVLVGGVANTTRQAGATIGVAILLATADGAHARQGISTVSGDRIAVLVAAGVGFAGTLAACLGPRHIGRASIAASITTIGVPAHSDTSEQSIQMRRTA